MFCFGKHISFFAVILTLFFVNPFLIHAQTGDSIYKLKSGSKIKVKMDTEINSESSSVDDTFLVEVVEPIKKQNVAVLAVGEIIEGRIIDVSKASSNGKHGKLKVVFETLKLKRSGNVKINAVLVKPLKIKSSKNKNLLTILGGTAIGGILGAVIDSGSGAIIGAGIGAGAGLGTSALQKGKEVKIKTDEEFEIKLTKGVTLPAQGV